MDPREAGKLGGRPSKAAAARSAAARAVASGSQRTLNFSGNLTLSGTFKGTVNINIGGAPPSSSSSRAAPTCSAPLTTPPTGPPTRPTGRTSPPTRPTAPPREKGVRFYCFVSKRGYAILVATAKGTPQGGGVLNFGRRRYSWAYYC